MGSRRIFVAVAGRSGLIAKFFAIRLMHSGYDVYVVGEIVTPSIRQGDLFIVISGSGETETMLAFTKRAKEMGARILLISTKNNSIVGDLAGPTLPTTTSRSLLVQTIPPVSTWCACFRARVQAKPANQWP